MVNPQAQQGVNPRTTRVRQVILDAAADLLVEHGAGEVTASRIAQETGVARTTIYRHWPDQSHLLLDTIDSLVAPHSPTTFTDDLEADLMTALSNLRARMTRQPFRQVFAALLGHANRERRFVAAQQRFVNGVLQPINDILTVAIDRGDVSPTVDIPQACAALAGPLFHQHVMLRESIDDHLITSTVHQFLAPAPETESP
jgi:AcrR family transcriptional regulator